MTVPVASSIQGRVALITGSTRGIGAGIAKRFGAAGVRVVVTGRSKDDGLAVEAEIRDGGGEATYVPLDIGVEEKVAAAVDTAVATYGQLDILVNNAAPTDLIVGGVDGSVVDLSTEALTSMMIPTLYGQFWACKYAIPHLTRHQHGAIVNISSMGAKVGLPRMAAYTMAKGGLNAMSRQIAVDFADTGLRSNTIVIGYVLSGDLVAVIDAHPQVGEALRTATLTRPGLPADIAEAALFLASDSAGYITGSEINLDGGLLCTRNLPDIPSAFAEA